MSLGSFLVFLLYLPFFLLCSYCQRVVKLLNQIGANFELIELDKRGRMTLFSFYFRCSVIFTYFF